MEQELSPLVAPEELVLLGQSAGIILIDASAGAESKKRYALQHLAGAHYVDLDKSLSDIKPDVSVGGRHPLPSPAQFSTLLAGLGITPASHVIIYDDKQGAGAASRLWWMMKSVGHKKVQVVNGGFKAAVAAGFPLSAGEAQPAGDGGSYGVVSWTWPLIAIAEVEKAAGDERSLVIDVREAERYNGEKEPIDLVAGHIPGAVNIPYTGNLDTNGFFRAPGELGEKYLTAISNRYIENVIVHCGSGVTACHTILAMAHAGLPIPRLYVGSWSEWSRSGRPIATLKDK